MKKYIPFILSIISCMVYCFCISLVNIYRPIEHMDISIGILLRLSVIVMFLTLLTGMLIVQFTKKIFSGNSRNHTNSIMGFLCEVISLLLVCLYGNIRPDLFYIHIYLMALWESE